jgi:hypothetical protein
MKSGTVVGAPDQQGRMPLLQLLEALGPPTSVAHSGWLLLRTELLSKPTSKRSLNPSPVKSAATGRTAAVG